MEKPDKRKYGYIENDGSYDEPSGWAYRGGEEAYYEALKKWEAGEVKERATELLDAILENVNEITSYESKEEQALKITALVIEKMQNAQPEPEILNKAIIVLQERLNDLCKNQ